MDNSEGMDNKRLTNKTYHKENKSMNSYKIVETCRISGNNNLVSLFSLGKQVLSGIFPESVEQRIPETPLDLVKCDIEVNSNTCGLLQLKYSADVEEMYGTTYGYYSSLSSSMVNHLQKILDKLSRIRTLRSGDAVLDIGCNDGTLLNLIKVDGLQKVGIDPSSKKFSERFDKDINLICDYFSDKLVRENFGDIEFHQITAIAMFYDLDEPIKFLKQIRSLLAKDGIWAIEIFYLPTMLTNLVYDQICHEHVTYPSLTQIEWMTTEAGLKILDVDFNNVNGGSFLVQGSREDSNYKPEINTIRHILNAEKPLQHIETYRRFEKRIHTNKNDTNKFINNVNSKGQTVIGYGASTKGNIVLNYCGIGPDQLPAICDVNPEKWGRITPGSHIPIISKEEMRKINPDYLFVLIWHFHREVLEDECEYVINGGKIAFHLPRLHIVDKSNYEHHLHSGFSDYGYTI